MCNFATLHSRHSMETKFFGENSAFMENEISCHLHYLTTFLWLAFLAVNINKQKLKKALKKYIILFSMSFSLFQGSM